MNAEKNGCWTCGRLSGDGSVVVGFACLPCGVTVAGGYVLAKADYVDKAYALNTCYEQHPNG